MASHICAMVAKLHRLVPKRFGKVDNQSYLSVKLSVLAELNTCTMGYTFRAEGFDCSVSRQLLFCCFSVRELGQPVSTGRQC